MFDNVNGARLAAKRVQEAFGLKASIAKEAVARSGSWRDWHHLEHTLAAERRGTISHESLAKYLQAKGVGASPDAVLAVIAPGQAAGTNDIASVMAAAPSLGFIDHALKGSLQTCARDAENDGISPARDNRDGIETIWYHANPANAFGMREEDLDFDPDEEPGPHDGPPGELRYGFDDVSVRDLQWIVRDETGTPIAAATASHLDGDCVWTEALAEIDDSPMADAEILMPLLDGAYEPMELQFLTINAIEVNPTARGRGVGTRLMRRILEDVRALSGNDRAIEVLTDASHHRQVRSKAQQVAFAEWLSRPAIRAMTREIAGTDGPDAYISGRLHGSGGKTKAKPDSTRGSKSSRTGGGRAAAYSGNHINWIYARSDQFVEHMYGKAVEAIARAHVGHERARAIIDAMGRAPLQLYASSRGATWIGLHAILDDWTSPPSAMPVGGSDDFDSDEVILASTLDIIPMLYGLALVPTRGNPRASQHPRGHWIWSQTSHPLAIRDIALAHDDMDSRLSALDERMTTNLLQTRPVHVRIREQAPGAPMIMLGQGLPEVPLLPPGPRPEAPIPAMPGVGRIPARVMVAGLAPTEAMIGERLGDLIPLPGCGIPHVDAAVAALTVERVGTGEGELHLAPVHHVGFEPYPDEAVRIAMEALAGRR